MPAEVLVLAREPAIRKCLPDRIAVAIPLLDIEQFPSGLFQKYRSIGGRQIGRIFNGVKDAADKISDAD